MRETLQKNSCRFQPEHDQFARANIREPQKSTKSLGESHENSFLVRIGQTILVQTDDTWWNLSLELCER